MKIIQLTDLHLGKEGEDTNGIDVRDNFLRALELVEECQPDCLVITGDLCYKAPEKEIYEWAKSHLDKLSVPFELIAGNHDEPVMMSEVFNLNGDLKPDGIYYSRKIAGEKMLFLDTAPAKIAPPQMEWIREQLNKLQQDLIIFMHHPPLLSDVPFMDKNHAFKNRSEIQQLFSNHTHNLTIFTGHYHVERTLRLGNMEVNITPSTFFQISRKSPAFEVDHKVPAFRVIEKNGGKLGHSVVYF
ncbi:MAG: metallophosphoesterase [Saprospiraceae bacterium]|nr:metallophosphoesterase [Saprospiraceae bacterium]MCB9326041.1 metallophosphoesterase [Lewinellaceae bacterium]